MTHTQQDEVVVDGKHVTLKVAGGSPPAKVAGSIVKNLDEGKVVDMIAMGAGAVNQAVKAIAIARGMAAPQGWNLSTIPSFTDEIVDGEKKTAIKFRIIRG